MGTLTTGRNGALVSVALLAFFATAMPAAAQPANSASCPKLASSVRANWDENLIGLASARRAIGRAMQDANAFAAAAEDVAAARSDCTRLLNDKAGKGSIFAYECAGDSAYLTAKYRPGQSAQQRDADYAAAWCAYDAEVQLAKGNGQRERERRAAALEGQGRALQGRSELGGANASKYLFDALTAYSASADLQATSQRLLTLARAQADAGRARDASATYDKLQGMSDPAFTNALRASALREQARIQQRDPASFSVAATRELWNRARGMDSTAESHFGYAKTFFDAGDTAAAKTAFGEASNARNEGSGFNYANEAAYYVAIIDARTASTSAQWGQVLASAERAGRNDARYRRLSCMAYIGRGGEALRKDDPAGLCAGDDTAEGLLLRGMYSLRRAQHLPTECKQGVSQAACRAQYQASLETLISGGALSAFQRGKGAAGDAVFNWLEVSGATEPKLRDAHEFGETLGNSLLRIDGCRRSPTGVASAMELFRRLDLIGCAPSN